MTQQPKPVSVWDADDQASAERIAGEMLAGVGIADRELAEHGMTVLHVRRETTAEERDRVFSSPRGREIAIRHEKGE